MQVSNILCKPINVLRLGMTTTKTKIKNIAHSLELSTPTSSLKTSIVHFVTSSLKSTSCFIPSALHDKSLLMIMSHSLIRLPLAHHFHPPSRIHYFIPGSKLAFSTNLFHHSLPAPTGLSFRPILDRAYSAQRF